MKSNQLIIQKLKIMKENYQKVTGENDQDYLMLTNDETELISGLPWKGRILYEMLKEQQQKRFLQMKQSGELIPFLQKISKTYYNRMNHHIIDNGMIETEAEELEWPELTKAAGLS